MRHNERAAIGLAVVVLAFAIVIHSPLRDSVTGYATSSQLTTTASVNNANPAGNSSAVSDPITLLPGPSRAIVWCNVTVSDENGAGDVANVNATLYFNATTLTGAADSNLRYINYSCAPSASGGIWKSYNCSFTVDYCAHVAKSTDGTGWVCSVFTNDSSGAINVTNVTNIRVSTLVAIGTNQTAVAYGTVNPGAVSGGVELLITNWGNVRMDLNQTASNMSNVSGVAGFTAIADINVSNQNYSTAITFDEPEDNGVLTNASLINATYDLANSSSCASGFASSAAQNRSAWYRLNVDTGTAGANYQGYINLVASDGT